MRHNFKAAAAGAAAAAAVLLLIAASPTVYRGTFSGSNGYITNLHSTTITNSGALDAAEVYADSVTASGSVITADVFYGNGSGVSNSVAATLQSGAVANGYLQVKSNAVSAWPTAPTVPGAFAVCSSNGVVYVLTSGVGATWTGTNKIAP